MKHPLAASPAQARQTKEEFANPDAYLDYELGKAVQELPPIFTRLVGVTLSLAVFGAIAWAGLSKVDEVAVAPGKVLPAGEQEVQPVQSLSSGKIKDIKVRQGQQVQKGEILIALDSNAAQVDIEMLESQAQSIRKDLERARTAAAKKHKAVIEKAQYEHDGLKTKLQTAERKKRKECPFKSFVYQELPGAYGEKCKDAEDELTNSKTLVKAKEAEIKGLNEDYKTGPLSELSKRKQELNSVEGNLKQAQIQLQNQNIIAPINGTVYEVKVSPSQGTVQPNEVLFSIAPEGRLDEQPVLAVDLPSQYRGFVESGMRAKVKIDTFPYQEFGTIDGIVIDINPDISGDNSGKQVFPTRIKLNTNFLRGRRITPGMLVTGEIVMREKSVLSLILDPITRQVDEVFDQK
jgi:HlyD family secretion protein